MMAKLSATVPTEKKEPKFDAILKTPFGALGVCVDEKNLTSISFLPPGTKPIAPPSALAAEVCEQLATYLADPKAAFDLPLSVAGTPFQQRVWRAIAAIPHGKTLTYGDIARKLNSAPRAVGQACGRNPYPVAIPCHRVVAADGGLGGFARSNGGFLLDTKRWLLEHEGVLK